MQSKHMRRNRKCVLSLRVARQLIAKGYPVLDIEPSRKVGAGLVFIFENSKELQYELERVICTGK
ncbi:hypothetical protein [Priestia flexa]|uniref:hypothetical protein n=1 Tax=Priestia flexa TaxID=86664 RepID=UPI001C989C76|nr:hypothetical protein [Priestia flexa]MBY6087006.1 hypothetical protein [Priestia flexa]